MVLALKQHRPHLGGQARAAVRGQVVASLQKDRNMGRLGINVRLSNQMICQRSFGHFLVKSMVEEGGHDSQPLPFRDIALHCFSK